MKKHKPVLLGEAIEGLNLKRGSIVVDATLGSGGHSKNILKIIGKRGKLIGIDCDEKNIENLAEMKDKNVFLVNDNFSRLDSILKKLEIEKANTVLADLGYSSDQLEDESYGLSFQKEASLDMRLDKKRETTAKNIVNEYSEEDLSEIIKEFGEDRWARKIAKAVIFERKKRPIETTKELAEIIKKSVPQNKKEKIHPATRTFQALRIVVNQELTNLNSFLEKAIESLVPGGRLAVISFHSIEDRIIKNNFRQNARGCICPDKFPKCLCGKKPKIRIINKKPIVASEKEREENPRSRSAKLRIVEKI